MSSTPLQRPITVPGTVYLVGAGPGAPDLMTLRGQQVIREADVILYDFLVGPEILDHARPNCERIYVGKRPGEGPLRQEQIIQTLIAKAKEDLRVVRLKGGDPFVFGRGGEELAALTEGGVPFVVVPGVTASLAAAASTLVPLTHRGTSSALTLVTGHEDPEKGAFQVDFEKLAACEGTICLYMGMSHLETIADRLVAGGRAAATPVLVVQWATLPNERRLEGTLGDIAGKVADAGMGSPAVVVIGEVVGVSAAYRAARARPLEGRRVVVTRNRERAGELAARLTRLGAEVLELPMIEIREAHDEETVGDVFAELGSYDWLVFTSANGVEHFFRRYREHFADLRSLGLMRIGAIGKGTADALRQLFLHADLVPAEATGEALAEALLKEGSVDNLKFLVVTGNRNREALVSKLEENAAIVDQLQVYATDLRDLENDPAAARFREAGADAIVFTSSSAVDAFIKQAGNLALAEGAQAPFGASLGPVTSERMRAAGIPVGVEAKEATMEALVDGLVERFAQE